MTASTRADDSGAEAEAAAIVLVGYLLSIRDIRQCRRRRISDCTSDVACRPDSVCIRAMFDITSSISDRSG
jgi:hypothetical protein